MRQAVREAVADGREITFPETAYGDPRDVRGLPAITKGVGGTSPQTQPEAEAIRRITRAGG